MATSASSQLAKASPTCLGVGALAMPRRRHFLPAATGRIHPWVPRAGACSAPCPIEITEERSRTGLAYRLLRYLPGATATSAATVQGAVGGPEAHEFRRCPMS